MLTEILKKSTLGNAKLIEPATIKYMDHDIPRYLLLHKEAQRFIYNKIGISASISKKIYEIDPVIWDELIQPRMDNRDLIEHLDVYQYMVHNSEIVSIFENNIQQDLDRFEDAAKAFDSEVTVNELGVLQMEFTLPNSDYKVLFDLDMANGIYKMFDAVKYEDRLIISTCPVVESKSFDEFISSVDLETEMNMVSKLGDRMKEDYSIETAKGIILSVREVLDTIKWTKSHVVTDDDGNVQSIDGFFDDNSNTVSKFLRSFNLPFKTLSKLGYLRKSLKYHTLSLDDMLKILSKEYYSKLNNVNADIISHLLKTYSNKESDKTVVEDEIR